MILQVKPLPTTIVPRHVVTRSLKADGNDLTSQLKSPIVSLVECAPTAWSEFQCAPYYLNSIPATAMPGMPEPFWIYANVSSMRHTIVGESEMYAFSHEAEDYYRDPSEVCTRLDQNVYSSIVWYSPKEPCCFIENGYRNFSKLETGILGIKEGFERRRQSESVRKLNLWSIQKEVRVMMLWTFFAGPFRRGGGY